MSESFISIVDYNVSVEDAVKSSKKVIQYFIDNEIIEGVLSGCILADKPGYKPGKKYLSATDVTDDMHYVSNCNYDHFSQLKTNGLEVCLNHCAAVDPSGEWRNIRCPVCGQESPQDKVWNSAVSEWMEGKSEGLLKCPLCNHISSVTSWDHLGDLALGHLVFTFWNWPPLSKSFLVQVSEILGNPIKVIEGKL